MPQRSATRAKPTRRSKDDAPKRATARKPGEPWQRSVPKFGALVCKAIIAALRKGATHRLAATVSGIDPRTMKTWLARGRENLLAIDRFDAGDWPPDEPQPALNAFGAFALDVRQAEGAPELVATECLVRAAGKDWRAASDFLRRRQPAEYSEVAQIRRVAIDEEGRVTQADTPETALLDKLEQQLARMEALQAGDDEDDRDGSPDRE